MTRFIHIYFIFFGCIAFVSCDSGDIYTDNIETRNNNISVTGKFVLSGNADTENYQLYFAAFEDGEATPVVWTRVVKPQHTDTVSVSLSSVPPQAVTVRLCLLNIGRRTIYDFFSFDISLSGNDTEIPLTAVSMNLKYEKIQNVFERNYCIECHSSESGRAGAGLFLDKGVSYGSLVNKPSRNNSTKMRVAPKSVSNSFLIDALTIDNLKLGDYAHSGFINRQDDINLLKAWIESGAKNE